MKYSDYLKSNHWNELREKKHNTVIKRCGICSTDKQIDTHHLIYRNLFDVETSDLRLLCRRCHFLAHDLMKSGRVRFRSISHHSRWAILKHAVKKHLCITMKNMFADNKSTVLFKFKDAYLYRIGVMKYEIRRPRTTTLIFKRNTRKSMGGCCAMSKRVKQQEMFNLPSWMPIDAWNGYLEMRRKIKKPMTEYAVSLAIKKLWELKQEGNDPKDVLEKSILNSYQGLFEVKNSNGQYSSKAERRSAHISETTRRVFREDEYFSRNDTASLPDKSIDCRTGDLERDTEDIFIPRVRSCDEGTD